MKTPESAAAGEAVTEISRMLVSNVLMLSMSMAQRLGMSIDGIRAVELEIEPLIQAALEPLLASGRKYWGASKCLERGLEDEFDKQLSRFERRAE